MGIEMYFNFCDYFLFLVLLHLKVYHATLHLSLLHASVLSEQI